MQLELVVTHHAMMQITSRSACIKLGAGSNPGLGLRGIKMKDKTKKSTNLLKINKTKHVSKTIQPEIFGFQIKHSTACQPTKALTEGFWVVLVVPSFQQIWIIDFNISHRHPEPNLQRWNRLHSTTKRSHRSLIHLKSLHRLIVKNWPNLKSYPKVKFPGWDIFSSPCLVTPRVSWDLCHVRKQGLLNAGGNKKAIPHWQKQWLITFQTCSTYSLETLHFACSALRTRETSETWIQAWVPMLVVVSVTLLSLGHRFFWKKKKKTAFFSRGTSTSVQLQRLDLHLAEKKTSRVVSMWKRTLENNLGGPTGLDGILTTCVKNRLMTKSRVWRYIDVTPFNCKWSFVSPRDCKRSLGQTILFCWALTETIAPSSLITAVDLFKGYPQNDKVN